MTPIKETSLDKWKLSKEIKTGNNAEVSGLPGAHHSSIHLHHSSSIYDRGTVREKGHNNCKCQKVCFETISPGNSCRRKIGAKSLNQWYDSIKVGKFCGLPTIDKVLKATNNCWNRNYPAPGIKPNYLSNIHPMKQKLKNSSGDEE